VVVAISSLGLATSAAELDTASSAPIRMVYLNLPGPGGGGGGGGLRQKLAPPKAKREGERRMSSPLPPREDPPPAEPKAAEPEPPKPAETEPLPPVVAPVAASPADDETRPGVLEETDRAAESRGRGDGGGVGTGTGTGIGEGSGSGIGPGSGGGTGGGPYRPGSGVEPPRLLREVKPQYTEEARRAGVTGEVVLEIVVRRDGGVGDVRVLDGLGAGLDEKAVAAVRQWRFAPAQRLGSPVDVLVEVAVEFRLR